MLQKYDHKKIEKKWQDVWEKKKSWEVKEDDKTRKFYILDMFPYPSAEGLHVGHPEGYTASDIVARYLRMKGKNVLHPMGFDSFGLPAENYAIKTGAHPAKATEKNIKKMRQQIKSLGFSYDWSREVITSDPAYYKWTQWIFIQLFKHGLAYEADAPINWCPSCKTGLANEEVISGKCERCGHEVGKKQIKQWLVKITDERYIERLLNDLDRDEIEWPDSIKLLQKNWIGRSEGTDVNFEIDGHNETLTVFTTRPDTLFGATYMVLAPEHPWLKKITTKENKKEVEAYIKKAEKKSDLERTDLAKEKTGVFTGAYAINPVNDEKIPIWVADYILISYGTGAIMAVPAHDERDFEFAKKFKLPIKCVVVPAATADWGASNKQLMKKLSKEQQKVAAGEECYSGKGYSINSGQFNGLYTDQFKKKITVWLEKNKAGKQAVNYKLRDWLFSRQRYWGEPIPIVHCEECKKKYKQTFLVVHGIFGHAQENWLPWFKKELEQLGHEVIIPNLPNADKPKLNEWLAELKKVKSSLGDNVVIVAHSLGAPTVCKFIEQEKIKAKKLFLIAPTGNSQRVESLKKIGLDKSQIESIFTINKTQINWPKVNELVKHKFIYFSDNDPYIPLDVKNDYQELESEIKVFKNKGHFNTSAGVTEFPEIFEDIKPMPVGLVPVPESELPLELPKVKDYKPTGTGESPLAAIKDWINTKCPQCGGPAKRETNTMPQWAGSNWYWLRYCDPKNNKQLADPEKLKAWLPVDLYVGGAEHAVLHLLYARFIYKFLYDIGTVPKECGDEPFVKLKNQGIVLGEDGQKMSKSRGNVINPDDVIEQYGADTLRMYEMFMGPFEDMKPWSTKGIVGIKRFLDRVWLVINEHIRKNEGSLFKSKSSKLIHKTIKKVTEDIEAFKFNTAISTMMEWFNARDWGMKLNKDGKLEGEEFDLEAVKKFIIILSPFAPHLAEELWEKLGYKKSITFESWPKFDELKLIEKEIMFVVQVNGKLRDNIKAPVEAIKEEVKKLAMASPKVKKYVAGSPKKIIFIKGRLINFVV